MNALLQNVRSKMQLDTSLECPKCASVLSCFTCRFVFQLQQPRVLGPVQACFTVCGENTRSCPDLVFRGAVFKCMCQDVL